MEPRSEETPRAAWRDRLHEIVFEADTPMGKAFDVALLVAILVSVGAVVLESVATIGSRFGAALRFVEWVVTVLFSIEYIVRLLVVRRPIHYATSFMGIIDLLAVVPTWLSLFVPGAQGLIVIRAMRLLRVFRVFKVARYVGEMSALVAAIRATQAKITVFMLVVLTLVLIMGTMMYVVEGPTSGFTSIPRGVYWAIVTVTTVGYGDIAPVTVVGQAVAALAMILGYSLIIIPTGIFSVELVEISRRGISTQSCRHCSREGHDADAIFCKFCGAELNLRDS